MADRSGFDIVQMEFLAAGDTGDTITPEEVDHPTAYRHAAQKIVQPGIKLNVDVDVDLYQTPAAKRSRNPLHVIVWKDTLGAWPMADLFFFP
jgi:hypothetical protein